jgi:hypothetical protein
VTVCDLKAIFALLIIYVAQRRRGRWPGRHHTLAGEPIECPEQHTVESALVGVLEQGGELLSSGRALPAALLVDVLVSNLVVPSRSPNVR